MDIAAVANLNGYLYIADTIGDLYLASFSFLS
jgi:hypothetical protein